MSAFKQPISQDRIVGVVEGSINAAMEVLIAIGLVLFVAGTSSLFVVGTIYLNSLVGPDLPDLGQSFGP